MTFPFKFGSEESDVHLSIYDSIHLVSAAHWKEIAQSKNFFLSIPYLSALEDSKPRGISFKYVVFYNTSFQTIGILTLQMLDVTQKNLQNQTYSDEQCHIKFKLLNAIDVKAMVCGNVFAAGENGWLFDSSISPELAYSYLSYALQKIQKSEKTKDKTSVVLLKEFWPKSIQEMSTIQKLGYKDFQIDVNMVLNIDSNWHSIHDYLECMVTKFRTKVKSILKKSDLMTSKSLSEKDLVSYQADIMRLYHQVIEKADFNFGTLTFESFLQFKHHVKEKCILTGYFLRDKMVGFSLAFKNNQALEANFVGIDYAYNQEYAIYQRMLVDFVEYAILHQLSELRLGRTAEEVKSCLGAMPVPMTLFVKHRNIISHQLLKTVVQNISPRAYELRKPFKAEYLAHTAKAHPQLVNT